MNWSTEKSLKDQVLRWWEQGDLLRARLKSLEEKPTETDAMFPLRLTLKSPTSSELSDRFDEVRAWIAQLSSIKLLHIDWRELNHRVVGKQKIPQSAWLTSINDAMSFIAKRSEEKRFIDIATSTKNTHPELLTWLKKRPLLAISLHQEWEQLLAIVSWMKQHPHPGIYLRQIDIAGVHSKFIEAHKRVLAELLDLSLPAEAIHPEHTGVSQFAARYGFLDKPQRIRFRSLDNNIHLIDGTKLADISLDAENFAKLGLAGKRVFITENEINFLAFPQVDNAIVIFGAGYGWYALTRADWLRECDIHYWGDIDTHGFAILNQLRHDFPHVRSFLMDQATFMTHQNVWGTEEQQVKQTLQLLSEEEKQLFEFLKQNAPQRQLRLEQEHVGFDYVMHAITELPSMNRTHYCYCLQTGI